MLHALVAIAKSDPASSGEVAGAIWAACISAVAVLATLGWTIWSHFLTKQFTKKQFQAQLAATESQLKTQLDADAELKARDQFQTRLAWAFEQATSSNPDQRVTGIDGLRDLIFAPWASPRDRDYAERIARRFG